MTEDEKSWGKCWEAMVEREQKERSKCVDALGFVDAAICQAYQSNWSEESLKVLVYDCREKIKEAVIFRAALATTEEDHKDG